MIRAVRYLLLSAAVVAAPAPAAIFIFQAPLSGAQESPPVASPGTGFTTVTYDNDLQTLSIEGSFSGLLGPSIAAHIHVRDSLAVANGGVATQLPSFAGFPLGVTAGSFNGLLDLTQAGSWNPAFIGLGTPATAETALFNALQDGRAYLNIHSSFAPGGEIRGDLAAVPEPATWGMMLLGFGLAGAALRYRRRQTRVAFAAA